MGCCVSTPFDHKQADERGTLPKSKTNFEEGTTHGDDKAPSPGNSGKVPRLDMTKLANAANPGNGPTQVAFVPSDAKVEKAVKQETKPQNDESPGKQNEKTKKTDTHATTQANHDAWDSFKDLDTKPIDSSKNIEYKKKGSSKSTLKVGPEIFVSLKTGAIEDDYKLNHLLGEGAYGKVLMVTHRTTGIVRAMKSVKKKSVTKNEEEKLFAEVSILRELDHPNIMKLYELYQDELSYYLVMEYCNGGELFDRIQQMQSFTEKQAAEYMKQLLSAMVYCHSKHIVHRDLKPENLLLDSKKHNAALKVIDFGTAQRFETGVKMTHKFGTPYYIAPEVLARSYDEKCDVWSCGIILYILLSGYPPFNGRTDADILNKIKIGKFQFDNAEWGRISQDAKNLISKMLTYNPAKRPSASEALNDIWLQKNAKNQPVNKKVLENLSSFSSQNKLKQAVLTFIVTQISTQQEKDELQRTFQQLDKDGNGILTKEELVEGYKKVFGSKEKAEENVQKIFDEVDVNGSGEVDFSEFIMAAMNKEKLLSQQKISQAFKLFDQNGDGFITRDELAAVMGGIELDENEWNQIIDEVDINKDGKISKEEFVDLLHKTSQAVKK